MRAAAELNASGLVIHLPKKGVAVIVAAMRRLDEALKATPHNVRILLEMPASKPDDNTYETPAKLNRLCRAIIDSNVALDWGLCIDTAHQWSCGVNMAAPDAWSKWTAALDVDVLERIKLIHLNGAMAVNFGKGKDVHITACSAADAIWGHIMDYGDAGDDKNGDDDDDGGCDLHEAFDNDIADRLASSSLGSIMRYCKTLNVDIIAEINRGTILETKLAMKCLHFLNDMAH
jgi:hypothetical protein